MPHSAEGGFAEGKPLGVGSFTYSEPFKAS